MDSQEYWKRRQIEREQKWHELTTRELSKLRKYYISAGKEIEKEIALLYAKFARENKLPPEEARRLIRGDEFKAWRMTLEEYVAASKSNPKVLRELNTLAMRSRISRIEAIHAKTLMEIISLGERLQETADNHLYRAYLDTYYQNLYDYHKTVGLTTPPASLDRPRVESVLQTAWVGKNYSKRIWANTTQLTKEIQRSMLTAIHRGSSIQQLSSELSRRMSVGYKNAERLIRTELNSVENRASAAAMKEAEFEYYQFVAAMDRRTCPRCGEKDGEVFALADMNQGENAPPLHPRCRCTIVATFDTPKGKSRKTGERAAREVGDKRERVPIDMTYRDWKAIYIDKTKTFDTWRAKAESGKTQSGALNPESLRAEEHSFRYYESVRHMKTDCRRIADNTGFREEDIQRIKKHVFYAEHELYDGEKGRFYPSYHMSQSWQRLIDGRNIQNRDIVLLNHEFLESIIESEGFTVQNAHAVAEAIYNYSALIK